MSRRLVTGLEDVVGEVDYNLLKLTFSGANPDIKRPPSLRTYAPEVSITKGMTSFVGAPGQSNT